MAAYLDTPAAVRRRRAFMAALAPMFGHDAAILAIDIWENAFGSEQPLWRGLSQFSSLVIQELNWKIRPEDLALRLVEHLQLPEQSLPPDPGPPRSGAQTEGEARPVGAPLLAPTIVPAAVAAPVPAPASAAAPVPRTEPDTPKGHGVSPAAAPVAGNNPSTRLSSTTANGNPGAANDDLGYGASTRTLCALLRCMRDASHARDISLEREVIDGFIEAAKAQLPGDLAEDLEALLTRAVESLARSYPKSRAIEVVNLFYVVLANVHGPIAADQLLSLSVHAVEAMPESRACAPRELL